MAGKVCARGFQSRVQRVCSDDEWLEGWMVDAEMMRACGVSQSAPAYRTALALIRHDCIDYAGIGPLPRTCAPHAVPRRAHFFASYGRRWRCGGLVVSMCNLQLRVCERWMLDAVHPMPHSVSRPSDAATTINTLPVCIRMLALCAGDKTGEFTVGLCNSGDANQSRLTPGLRDSSNSRYHCKARAVRRPSA